MTRRNLYYNYISYPYSYEEQLMRQNAPLNANVAGFGAWLRYPFNKNKRINAGFQEDTGSFNAPITDYNTTGNGTTDWNSGFVTGQMQQEQFTRPQSNQLNLTMDYQSNTEDNPIVEMNSGNVKESNDNTQGFNVGGGWASAIAPAANNAINAITDTNASTAERVSTAMGIPLLSKIWSADTTKGDANLRLAQQNLNNFNKNYIQDANSSWGAANAVRLNNQKTILPISNANLKNLTWKDFRGNMFMKGLGATFQGAASGSVGGPWGALGGAVTGLVGSLFGGIGAKKRAQRAYDDYMSKLGTIMSAQNSAYKQAMTNQSLSNMQALANGNMQQRINDMANIRAYGGNLYPIGGTIKEGDEEVAQEPVYEGGELPEITVSAESMPWYEKTWKSYKRNIINPLIQLPRRMTSLDAQYAESYDKDYFTFDEAYKDARNKGQKTFFWNNNYYNTDYEGSHGEQYKQDVASGKAANWEQTYPNYTNPELRREKQEELDTYGITNEQTKNKTPFDMLFRKIPARGYNLNEAISKMVGEFNTYDKFNNEEDLRASLLKKYPELNNTDIPIKTLSNGSLIVGNVVRPTNMSDEMWESFSDDVTFWNIYSGGEAQSEVHRGEYDYLLGFPNKSNSDYTGNIKISKYKTGSLPYYYTTSKIEESEPFISESNIDKYNTYYNNAMARIEELESKKKSPNSEKWQRDKANGIINMDRADAYRMDELLNMKYQKEIDKIYGDINAKRDDFINKYYDDENFRAKWENNGIYINRGDLDFVDWSKVSKLPEEDLKLLGDIGFLQNIPEIPKLKPGNHLAKSSDTDYYVHENDYNNGKYEKYIQFIKNKFTNNNDHNKYHKESVDLRDLINAGALGTYTLGVPKDDSYISVWDKFDIDPFGSGNDSPVIKIGNPYEYYTRFYRKGTEPNIDSLYNNFNNTRAMGGNLYPDGGSIDPYYPESQDPTAVNWLSDWYRQRPEQIRNTFYGSTYDMPNPNISGEYEELSDIPLDRTINPSRKFFDDSLYKNLIDRAATVSPVYRMDMPNTTLGEYSPSGQNIVTEDGVVNYPNAAHTISYNMRDVPAFANPDEDYYDKETLPLRIHENNHAITHGFDSVAKEINNRIVRKDGVEKDSYKDNPYEVHSYMMEFRNKAGLNPTDVITKDVLDKHRKELKETNLDRYTDDSLIDLLNNVVDNNDMKRYSNVAAFGGGLDLSPNMINLWNNKQYIDQQRVNTQQMNFGLGNSFNYKNMFPDGGIIPPNRPLTKEEIDRLTPAEREEYAKKQAIRLYKELYAPSPALYDSREEDDEHTYNVLNRPDQNPFSSLNVFANLFKPSNYGYIFSEENKRKEAAEKAQQHSGGSISWGGKLSDEYIDKMINAPDMSWVDYEEEKKTGKKYKESLRNPMPSASLFDKAVDTVLGWLGYGKTNEDKIYDDNSKFYANGGQINSSDLPDNMQYYANGGTHEQNPYGGIQVGVDQQGNPNLVEEGEFRWGDYVFSDRINVDPTLLSRYNLAPATKHQGKKANKDKLSYADVAKKYAKKNGELANDPIGKNTLEAYMKRLQDAQEDQKFQDSMEQQKQDAINQYRNALTTPQQGNPMYGAMKYNGMGNADTQQGVNAGMSDLGQQGGGNEVLSNTNRSGNNMLHALGGNLYWRGSFLKKDPPPYGDPNSRIDYAMNYIGMPTYNGNSRIDFANQYMTDTDKINDYGVSDFMNRIYSGNVGYGSPKVNTTVVQTQTPQNFQEWALWQHDNGNKPYVGSVNTGIEPDAFALQAQGRTADGSTVNADYTTEYNGATNTNTGMSNLTDGIKRDTTTTFGTAAVKGDPKQVPHYNTAGEYAMFGKGAVPMLYDWMNKTNFRYDPNQRPAYELADMGNNSTFLRTADTIGGYRAPNLIDVERMNNAAQAQGLAALQSALNVGNGNRGFAAAQAAQNAYNTQMGIGNNYATTQQINNDERYKTDAFNTAIDQFNANARNTSYQDNQKARQIGQQMAIDAKKAANDYILRNELYADATNRQAMENRAANQATWTDNALNYFIAQAQKNDILNAKNNDITNPYWTDKNGVMHYIGDSGLNSAIYNAFTDGSKEWGDYAVNNGTFTGDRLKAWNALQEKYSAADLKAHPELWKSLVLQEKQERRKEAEKADKAKSERVANARYAFDNNMAQINNYRTMYGDKFKNSQMYDDLMRRYNDKANATEFNDINNLDYWNRIMGDEIDYWRRYNTPVTANQSAYGGYINNNNKSNKREYYNYMRR